VTRPRAAAVRPLPDGLRLRSATPADLPDCERIWRTSIDDYAVRLGQHPIPEDNPAIRRLHGHALATDPDRFRIVEDADGRPVAFGSAVVRGPLWFLSMLFVLPGRQGGGVGRAILDAIGPDPATPGLVRATATDSAQPISNALYASLGIVPRTPLWRVVGEPDPRRPLPALPSGIVAAPFDGAPGGRDAADADALARLVAGLDTAADRAFLAADGRRGFAYRDGAGRLVAYGWASEAGRVGPVATEDPALVAPVLGHLVGVVPPRGAAATWVPGGADAALVPLLAAGWRLEGMPILLCWDRPFADLARYLPISPGLL
jgi:GNAT superfamily N-acetyltransferase